MTPLPHGAARTLRGIGAFSACSPGPGPDRAAARPRDVFIIHASADDSFVHGYLLPELGLAPDRALLSSTLRLGRPELAEIERAIATSRVTLVVVSPACFADPACRLGEQLAGFAQLARDTGGELIPLLRADCELPLHLRALVPLDYRDLASWAAASERLRRHLARDEPGELALSCPYPGMRAFAGGDARHFHGRDAEIDDIIGRLRRGEREIYVVGPSGSGKSSLVAAGLVPRLSRSPGLPGYLVRTLRPGERPLDRIHELRGGSAVQPAAVPAGEPASATAVARPSVIDRALAGLPRSVALLIVIDQLEELFALAGPDQRAGFFDAIRALRDDPRCVLVMTLRADFYAAFMDSPLWTDRAGQTSRVELGPLRGEQLRATIIKPAETAGVYFEPELVERLVADAADEPGALPLLQDTLVQLWTRRRRCLLALADYRDAGDGRSGLAVAIAGRADTMLRALTPDRARLALRILLRLVSFGEGRADTRRQQPRGALRAGDDRRDDFDVVYRRLIEDRLITVSGDPERDDARVDLAHEVLIRAWPQLGAWIRTWRGHELRRRQLEASAAAWIARGRGEGGLLDEVELAEVTVWRSEAARVLGESAELAAFVVASTQHHADLQRERAEAERGRRQADDERDAARQLLARAYEEAGRQLLLDGFPLRALPYLVAAREAGRAHPALRMLFHAAARNLPVTLPLVHTSDVVSAAFSPDGTRIVTASRDFTARVWDAASGAQLTPPLEHLAMVVHAAFSPDGARLVTASHDTVWLWDAATGDLVAAPLEHAAPVASVVFSPDGTRLVTASRDHAVRVWDVGSGSQLGAALHLEHLRYAGFSCDGAQLITVSSRAATIAAVSRDGARIVTTSPDHTACVWDTATDRALAPPLAHRDAIAAAAFSPDGSRVVTASHDRTARVWDAITGEPLTPPLEHRASVAMAAFSPDGSRVVTASHDRTARVWDAATGAPVSPSLEHQDRVLCAAFSPDGARVVTASWDRTACIWDATTGAPPAPPLVHGGRARSAAFSPDGARVVSASTDQTAWIWDVRSGRPVGPPLRHRDRLTTAAFSADGAHVVTASRDHTARVWCARTGEPITPPLAHRGQVTSAVLSRDGARAVTASDDHTARIWDATTGEPVAPPLVHRGGVACAALSADGARVVTASSDGTARVWDATTGEPVAPPLEHRGRVACAGFSRDGTRVVTASSDQTARVWDARTGQPLTPPLRHQGRVTSAVFSPDGTRVVTASADKTARVWDATTGQPVTPPLHHGAVVHAAGFSGDGARVITASADHTARVWSATTGKPLSPPLEHAGPVRAAELSPDGALVVTASDDHTARLWDARLDGGTLDDWRELAGRGPNLLRDGVLVPRITRVRAPTHNTEDCGDSR